MSNHLEEATKALIRNICIKVKNLKVTFSNLKKFGAFVNCPETHVKQYEEIMKEILISCESLEKLINIPHST